MSIFKDPTPDDIDNWACVLEGSTNLEIEMAKNYLNNLEIPSNILSKRDSAYSLNVGEMAMVYLYVPLEYEQEAREALAKLEDENPEFNPDSDTDDGE